MPKLTAIVLCMNSLENVKMLIPSLCAQTFKDIDILVSDNGSTDGTVEWLKQQGIRVIENGRNLGFSGGNNVALKQVKMGYVFLLNDDMRLDPRCIEEVVKASENDSKIAAVQSKVLNWDGTKIDMVGTNITYGSMVARRGFGEPAAAFSQPQYIESAGAGGVLFRMDALKKAGFFDESFNPAYYEDADLSERLKKAGYKIFYQPSAICYHKHGTTLKNHPTAALSSHRNRYRFLKKHWTAGRWLKALPFLPLITAYYLMHFEKAYFIATWEFLTGKLDARVWEGR